MKSKKLSVEAAAAIQAGIPPEQVIADIPEENDETSKEASAATTEVKDDNANCVDKSSEAPVTAPSIVDQLVSARVDLAATTAALENSVKSQAGLKEIVVNHLIAANASLGLPSMTAEELKAIDTSALIAQHSASTAMLAKRYGVGSRVSLPAAEAEESDEAAQAQAKADEADKEFIRKQNLKLARPKR